jgi:hypothetical protein
MSTFLLGKLFPGFSLYILKMANIDSSAADNTARIIIVKAINKPVSAYFQNIGSKYTEKQVMPTK